MVQELAQKQAQELIENTMTQRDNESFVSQVEDENKDWLFDQGLIFEKNEEAAAIAVRQHCGIHSRIELSSNKEAQKLWTDLLGEFESRGNHA